MNKLNLQKERDFLANISEKAMTREDEENLRDKVLPKVLKSVKKNLDKAQKEWDGPGSFITINASLSDIQKEIDKYLKAYRKAV